MSDELINKIKVWIEKEGKITHLQNELKQLKKERKEMNEELKVIMRENNLDNIDTKTGQIRYIKSNVKKGFNKKDLSNILESYYKDREEANKILNYIQEHREINIKETIQFKKK